MWVEPVATTKLLGCLHSPHKREFCTESLFGRHALGMLRRTLAGFFQRISFLHRVRGEGHLGFKGMLPLEILYNV